jgi:AbrB family looped-hinge helix DNA binding protein
MTDMIQEARIRVNENGRIVIPAQFRKALGIKAGDEVVLMIENNELRVTTQQRRIQKARERAQRYLKPGVSLAEELIADRRQAAKDE